MSLLGVEATGLPQAGGLCAPGSARPHLRTGWGTARLGSRRSGAPTTAATQPPAPVPRSATQGANRTDSREGAVGLIPLLTSRRSARLGRTGGARRRVRTLTSEEARLPGSIQRGREGNGARRGGAGGRGVRPKGGATAGEPVVKSTARAGGTGAAAPFLPHVDLTRSSQRSGSPSRLPSVPLAFTPSC